MAVDEAIMETVGARAVATHTPALCMNPPCLSLGYGQHHTDVDFLLASLTSAGMSVRRPTGGRAILHTDELTYSLSLPAEDELAAGTIVESYQRISLALLVGLSYLAQRPVPINGRSISRLGPVCLKRLPIMKITVGGRKLMGSAQMRREKCRSSAWLFALVR